jgi:CBS domain-containing protein
VAIAWDLCSTVFQAARRHVEEFPAAWYSVVQSGQLAVDCVEIMEAAPKVSQLLVVDAQQRLVGALHLHDLFRARIV